jgi:hypothetical protein
MIYFVLLFAEKFIGDLLGFLVFVSSSQKVLEIDQSSHYNFSSKDYLYKIRIFIYIGFFIK